MKTVLHILPSNSFSGAENVVCQIIKMFSGSDYKIYYLNEICYEYQVKTAREGLTHFVILNARLGYYSVRSKDTSVYIQCECRDNIMTFTLPKGEYYVERIIM